MCCQSLSMSVSILYWRCWSRWICPQYVATSDAEFQFSIGDAIHGASGRHVGRREAFQFSIGDARLRVGIDTSRCSAQCFNSLLEMPRRELEDAAASSNPCFNSLLEMPGQRGGIQSSAFRLFQFSIGDASTDTVRKYLTRWCFNSLLEMHTACSASLCGG